MSDRHFSSILLDGAPASQPRSQASSPSVVPCFTDETGLVAREKGNHMENLLLSESPLSVEREALSLSANSLSMLRGYDGSALDGFPAVPSIQKAILISSPFLPPYPPDFHAETEDGTAAIRNRGSSSGKRSVRGCPQIANYDVSIDLVQDAEERLKLLEATCLKLQNVRIYVIMFGSIAMSSQWSLTSCQGFMIGLHET